MKRTIALSLFAAGLALNGSALAEAVVGQQAPAFKGVDAAGKPVSLDQYKGKYVVLEWVNPDCPFVKKHYDSGNMPVTQKYAADKGVVWLSVSTSADGDNSKKSAAINDWVKAKKAMPTATIMDTGGAIGRAYGARTTPHMYLIDPAGKLVYAGAIDSKPTANPSDIKGATNYMTLAIDEALAGKTLSQAVTKPYGCSVKYS
ncbi:redoxin domain-containing protein [Massilia sp. IC2-477]|uniref:redoxin domain-containing protein n=1 Tax=Massilia sp. IC2-477 TaxID=2887198 RepID=UPI001D11360F|nr:redoxin domain-containing protein [Massilia sp. IC2-477]MCC2957621.1 redoxin domain-containing protein [Massilia sp. IC2-477]